VLLLKLPHPYRAALTVCSDTHATPVETFEAVHRLVNTRYRIEPGSDDWGRLFSDPEIETRWPQGIEGFGLPIADTFWLYDHRIGVFEAFDAERGCPVPNRARGLDFPQIVERWLRTGWVDSLHTPGQGPITRAATKAALEWLASRPHGRLKVWVNHSLDKTPTCIEPDLPALRSVGRNLARVLRIALYLSGLDGLGRRIVSTLEIRPYPPGQRVSLGVLTALLATSLISSPLALLAFGLDWRSLPGPVILAATLLTLALTPVRSAQGDNPGSPHYIADLVRDFGFRFYWMIQPQPGYATHISNSLLLPEGTLPGGRSSCFRIVTLDDGSRVLAFPRAEKESLHAMGSVKLLTEEGLRELLDRQGTSILYTHWTLAPPLTFDREALEGLARLQRLYEDGHVWVAPTSEILQFTFVRTFLDYEVRLQEGRVILDIRKVNDPIGTPYVPTLDDLRGISFEGPSGNPVEVRLAGEPVAEGAFERLSSSGRLVIHFPLASPIPHPRESHMAHGAGVLTPGAA
jgi:hypothetical protein